MKLEVLLLAILLLANLIATVMLVRSPQLSKAQRILQLGIVWLIPGLGAIVCGAFVRSLNVPDVGPGKMEPQHYAGDGGVPHQLDSPSVCGGGDGGGD